MMRNDVIERAYARTTKEGKLQISVNENEAQKMFYSMSYNYCVCAYIISYRTLQSCYSGIPIL